MSALLTAQAAAVHHHVFVNILVANGGLGVIDAQLVKGLVQAEVGHDRGHHRIAQELAPLLHVCAVDIENMVAGDDVALFIHTQAAVGISVVSKAHIQPIIHHKPLQHLNVGGAGVLVDVVAVGIGIDDIGLGTQSIKNRLGNVPGGTVGAVQTHLHSLEAVHTQRNQIADVAVTAGHMIHGAADLIPLGQRQGVPFPSEGLQLSVQIGFDQGDNTLLHLFAEAVDELDAVVIVGIVAGGDHNAAVKALRPDHKGHRGGGGNVK